MKEGERTFQSISWGLSASLHCHSVAAMGSFAKVLSQLGNVASARLAAPAATGTSRGIIQGSRANKQGLSLMLDGTLKAGHDMKTFGLGTAASLATVERYARFTAAMHHVYGTMERSFDASSSPVVVPLWQRFGDSLRREPSLALDLADVSSSAALHSRTPATAAYCAAIEDAAARDNADGGGRLIGHLYCRYFADLFGGQVSGTEWHGEPPFAICVAPSKCHLSATRFSPSHAADWCAQTGTRSPHSVRACAGCPPRYASALRLWRLRRTARRVGGSALPSVQHGGGGARISSCTGRSRNGSEPRVRA